MVKCSKQIMTVNQIHISGRSLMDSQFNEYRAWKPHRIKLSAHRSKVLLEVSKILELDPNK